MDGNGREGNRLFAWQGVARYTAKCVRSHPQDPLAPSIFYLPATLVMESKTQAQEGTTEMSALLSGLPTMHEEELVQQEWFAFYFENN